MKSKNLLSYLDEQGKFTFEESPFNAVDALALTVFAYLNFSGFGEIDTKLFRKAAQDLEKLPEEDRFRGLDIMKNHDLQLIQKAAESVRFRDLQMVHYVDCVDEAAEKQFAAVTFILPDDTLFVAYRGTDNTLTGWKEDCNMSFMNGTPAQLAAAQYAAEMSAEYGLPLQLGGQSKGGNLAVWAAANLPKETRDRVRHVYNMDGPGFTDEFLQSEGFLDIEPRILSFVPESSIVGVLLANCDYLSIRSSSYSLLQHDPFSWTVDGTRFAYVLNRSFSGRKLDKAVSNMLANMTIAEREAFVEEIFALLESTEAKTVQDLAKQKKKLIFHVLPGIVKAAVKYGKD